MLRKGYLRYRSFMVLIVASVFLAVPAISGYAAANAIIQGNEEFCPALQPMDPELRVLLDQVREGQSRLYAEGKPQEASLIFEDLISRYPDNRYGYWGLAESQLALYKQTNSIEYLREATESFIRASEIGMQAGVLHHTASIAEGLATLGDEEGLRSYFEKAVSTRYHPYLAALDYARGLTILNATDAEKWFQEAIALQPTDIFDATAYYAEWLLTHKRFEEVLELISKDTPYPYLHLLRGVALENLGMVNEARDEYTYYVPMSQDFPVKSDLRIEGSVAQEDLVFVGDPSIQSSCITNISRSIYCEARGETGGSQRAVGWTMRNRVFNNSTSNPCLNFGITGSTTCDKYVSAISRGFCACADGCATNPSTDLAATHVYYGRTPEPYTKWCPAGYTVPCNVCDADECQCGPDTISGGRRYGTMYFWATSSTCPSQHPVGQGCTENPSKLCGNGGSDNCYYRVP